MLTIRSVVSGQFATYETLSSWAFLYAAGLGNVEYTITVSSTLPLNFYSLLIHSQAYPGVCLADLQCYGGGTHGMVYISLCCTTNILDGC